MHNKKFTKRTLFAGVAVAMLLLGVNALVRTCYDFCSSKPKLLFTLPSEKCKGLSFAYNYRWALEVKYIIEEHGFDSDYTFASFEKKAICFELGRGDAYQLKFENGEQGIVYFYKYPKRFKSHIEVP